MVAQVPGDKQETEMRITQSDYSEKYEYLEAEFFDRQRRQLRKQSPRQRGEDPADIRAELTNISDDINDFVPSYAAALDPLHHERQWLINSVAPFYRDRLITDVTRIVKGGKEANVYCCTAGPTTGVDLIAAKLYRPRMLRHLRNDAIYKEGRLLLDSDGKEAKGDREARAIRKKTRFGKQLDIMNWIMHEYNVHQALFKAGADVPRPIAHNGNTILMAYVGDEWTAAPTLNAVRLEKAEARNLFERIMDNIQLMLVNHYIHGDLSAYNILYWEGKGFIIDFPQLVDARKNPNGQLLLERDVQRVCQYFARCGVQADPGQLAEHLWREYMAGDR
jgi:RIO kinase 1